MIPQLMPPGLALTPTPLLCFSCPQPNVAMPACPVIQQISLDKEQDPPCRDESKSHASKQQRPEWWHILKGIACSPVWCQHLPTLRVRPGLPCTKMILFGCQHLPKMSTGSGSYKLSRQGLDRY